MTPQWPVVPQSGWEVTHHLSLFLFNCRPQSLPFSLSLQLLSFCLSLLVYFSPLSLVLSSFLSLSFFAISSVSLHVSLYFSFSLCSPHFFLSYLLAHSLCLSFLPFLSLFQKAIFLNLSIKINHISNLD